MQIKVLTLSRLYVIHVYVIKKHGLVVKLVDTQA